MGCCTVLRGAIAAAPERETGGDDIAKETHPSSVFCGQRIKKALYLGGKAEVNDADVVPEGRFRARGEGSDDENAPCQQSEHRKHEATLAWHSRRYYKARRGCETDAVLVTV